MGSLSNVSGQHMKKSITTHSLGHALNLAVGDMVRHVWFLKDSMDLTYEISNLLENSSKEVQCYRKYKRI